MASRCATLSAAARPRSRSRPRPLSGRRRVGRDGKPAQRSQYLSRGRRRVPRLEVHRGTVPRAAVSCQLSPLTDPPTLLSGGPPSVRTAPTVSGTRGLLLSSFLNLQLTSGVATSDLGIKIVNAGTGGRLEGGGGTEVSVEFNSASLNLLYVLG